jgi:MerR family redox-sensitive transcriptional activator SoxR
MEDETLSIGEVAAKAQVSVTAIRFYERRGLLAAAERAAGRRRFDPSVIRRLEIIGIAKRVGFSLDEVRALLASVEGGTPAHEPLRALATGKQAEVEAMLERATRMRDWLAAASACRCETLESCALFAA